MWNKFIALAHRTGFTRNEAVVILFLGAAISAGYLISSFRGEAQESPDFRSVYERHDSLFIARSSSTAPTDSQHVLADITEARSASRSASKAALTTKVNINTADESELSSLPGVGISTARKIIAWRKDNGKFEHPEAIINVPGIGRKKFESMKHRIIVQ